MKKKLYLIKWHDACSCDDWQEDNEIEAFKKERSIIHEIGWIIHEDKEVLIICSQFDTNGNIGNTTRIPKNMVLSRRRIQCPKKANSK